MRAALLALLIVGVGPKLATAQRSLADRLRAVGTGTVAFSARARAEVCGDGKRSYSDGLSGQYTRFLNGMLVTYEAWDTRIAPCEPGPVRVTVRVVDGNPSWLRIAVGPLAALGDTVTDLGTVSTAEAGELLRSYARTGEGRISMDALRPITLIDSIPRWDILAAAARDTSRLQAYRRRAADALARAAAFTLGGYAETADEQPSVFREAVYALARQKERNEDPVPQLIEIARTNSHRDARVAALYSLGQTGDPRAVDLFTAMLSGRAR